MGATLQDAHFSSDSAGRFYVTLRYRASNSLSLAFFRGKFSRRETGFVGVDLGLKEYATLSDATVISNSRYYRKLEDKLAKAQRSLSQKKLASRRKAKRPKGDNRDTGQVSKSQARAELKVSNVHRRIASQRREFLTQTVGQLISDNSVVVIEDLNIEAMKERLGKSVSDASPAKFGRILTYMGERYGTQVIVADRYFPSSKTCSGCGTVKAKLSLSERQYDCAVCGLSLDRDLNAALNLELWGRNYLTQQEAQRYGDSLSGRGPEDSIASDQSRHKTEDARGQTANASHESLVTQEQHS